MNSLVDFYRNIVRHYNPNIYSEKIDYSSEDNNNGVLTFALYSLKKSRKKKNFLFNL